MLSDYYINPCLQLLLYAQTHHRARTSVRWKSVNLDVLYEFHWLFKLQSRSSHEYGNEGYESLLEGQRKMIKIFVLSPYVQCFFKLISSQGSTAKARCVPNQFFN